MRCKKHNTDLSSIVGVCASCLRERLFKLLLAQKQAEAQAQTQSQHHNNNNNNFNSNSNSNPQLPRAVSPYINNRKTKHQQNSVTTAQQPSNKPHLNHSLSDQRFYNSPLIAVTSRNCIGATSSNNNNNNKKKTLIKFSSFSNLFRSTSRDEDTVSSSSVTSSSTAAVRKHQRCVRDRGMSPVGSDDDVFSDVSSGYETAETESFKQTPRKTPMVRRGGGQRSVSEMVFCLSPLVRASPNRLWNVKGKPPLDGGVNGDVRPHISNVKSFCANRSRKLADFGRSHPNR